MSEKATVNGTIVFCLYLPVILFYCLLHLQSQSLRQRSRSMLILKSSCRMGPQGPSAAPLSLKRWSAVRPRWPGTSSRANPTVSSPKRRMWWVLTGGSVGAWFSQWSRMFSWDCFISTDTWRSEEMLSVKQPGDKMYWSTGFCFCLF